MLLGNKELYAQARNRSRSSFALALQIKRGSVQLKLKKEVKLLSERGTISKVGER